MSSEAQPATEPRGRLRYGGNRPTLVMTIGDSEPYRTQLESAMLVETTAATGRVTMQTSADRNRWSFRRQLRTAAPWLALLFLGAIGYWSVLPPSPLPSDAPGDQFSADRAFGHVEAIARQPHPMGSAAIAEVREYIIGELERMGLEPELQTVPAPDYFGSAGSVDVINILARIPGTEGPEAVAIMAHYDTVPATPGANDNTAAVATLLETGRALLSGPAVGRDVLLLFTDGEEPAPHPGSNAFVRDHPSFGDIALVVNLEANGGSGASVLAETSGPQRWLINELADADSHPAAFSFLTETARLMGNIGTDFDVFRNAGTTGMHFAYLRGSPIYHTAADNIAAVNHGSLQHHGNHALGTVRHFGDIDLTDPPGGDAVFFMVGRLFVHYPSGWAIPLAVVAFAACLVGAATKMRRTGRTFATGLRNTGRAVVVSVAATVVASIAWFVLAAIRSTPGVLESYVYLLVILVAAIWSVVRLAGNRPGSDAGTLLVWGGLGLITAAAAPGFSYLFTWPALAAGAAFAWGQGSGSVMPPLRFLLVTAPVVILTTPAIDIFFQFAQPRPGNPDSALTYAIALPVMLALLSAGLLRSVWPRATDEHPTGAA